jgi:AcrR family transcriptional regulator
VEQRQPPPPDKQAPALASGQPPSDLGSPSLWFEPPVVDQDRRPHQLTRDQVIAQALTIIANHGIHALTMRRLAADLGVVPGALYRHLRNKQQLHDLLLDTVLAEVDLDLDPDLAWTTQLTHLAHRLRHVLEAHPGIAAILQTRDPLGPHSLALAEAFLQPLHAAGFGDDQAGLGWFLLLDYTIGFAVGAPPTSVNEQRLRDPATRHQLHQFLGALPPDRFPTLVALGPQVWIDNRDQRFTTGLHILITGLQQARNAPRELARPEQDPTEAVPVDPPIDAGG